MTLPILSKGLSYCVDIVVSVILSSSFILLLDAVCFNWLQKVFYGSETDDADIDCYVDSSILLIALFRLAAVIERIIEWANVIMEWL